CPGRPLGCQQWSGPDRAYLGAVSMIRTAGARTVGPSDRNSAAFASSSRRLLLHSQGLAWSAQHPVLKCAGAYRATLVVVNVAVDQDFHPSALSCLCCCAM